MKKDRCISRDIEHLHHPRKFSPSFSGRSPTLLLRSSCSVVWDCGYLHLIEIVRYTEYLFFPASFAQQHLWEFHAILPVSVFQVIYLLSLIALKTFSLSFFFFGNLIKICPSAVFVSITLGISCAFQFMCTSQSLQYQFILFIKFGQFSAIMSSNIFLLSLLLAYRDLNYVCIRQLPVVHSPQMLCYFFNFSFLFMLHFA